MTIRMQRSGRSGHAQYRVVVQDRRTHPKSGRVVAYVGSYNPHSKVATLDKEKIETYLSNGAMPSDRVAKIMSKEGLKLPDWYKASPQKEKTVRNPEKRRSTAPEAPAEETSKTESVPTGDTPAEEPPETEKTDEKPSEPTPKEQPADEQVETDDKTEAAKAEPTPTEEPTSKPTEDNPTQ